MKRLFFAATALCSGLLAASCITTETAPAEPVMLPAAAGVLSTDQATTILAEARCDREARCNGIGPLAKYTTPAHCLSVMRQHAQPDLSTCAYGVKEREARACAVELRRQVCGSLPSPFDWVNQTMVCGTANLCLR